MLNHPRIHRGPEMATGFIEYEVVPDFSPVDFVEYFKMPAGLTQFLEIFAAFRTGEHTFGPAVLFHKVDGIKSPGGVSEYGKLF